MIVRALITLMADLAFIEGPIAGHRHTSYEYDDKVGSVFRIRISRLWRLLRICTPRGFCFVRGHFRPCHGTVILPLWSRDCRC